jgi:hypothetical protein
VRIFRYAPLAILIKAGALPNILGKISQSSRGGAPKLNLIGVLAAKSGNLDVPIGHQAIKLLWYVHDHPIQGSP